MANPTSKLDLVVNGVTTSYDIHDANAVDLTNNQTVGGIKTFSNAPVVGSILLDGKTIDTDANGNMTYDGHIVDTIEEQGNTYIRCSSGIQICWDNGEYVDGQVISYPKAFRGYPSVVASSPATPTNWGETNFTINVPSGRTYACWQAIGRWK